MRLPGGTYFFTLTLAERRGNDLLVRHVDALCAPPSAPPWPTTRPGSRPSLSSRSTCTACGACRPGDDDFPTRWRLIKARFSRTIPAGEAISQSGERRAERALWQRRYWEHAIRDERDLQRHMDYIHFNPVKHGQVADPRDWPYSSLHRLIAQGLYPQDWTVPADVAGLDLG